MVTEQIKKIVEQLGVDRKAELKRVIEEAEKAGISRGFVMDAIGRLASEGAVKVKDGVVRILK